MSTERFRPPIPQAPASLAAIRTAHHAAIRAGGPTDPASHLLFEKFKSENFFGGDDGWGAHNSTNSSPSGFQKSQPENEVGRDGIGEEEVGRNSIGEQQASHDGVAGGASDDGASCSGLRPEGAAQLSNGARVGMEAGGSATVGFPASAAS